MNLSRFNKILLAILALAFLLRLSGLLYGLPLWIIDDEPPFILAALKMIQLKTLIPAWHLEEFHNILYYPPYLSYLYLPFFALVAGFKYLFFVGNPTDFSNYLALNLSTFFIIARFINILLAVISIYLVCKISRNLFKNETGALFSAFFLSASLIHITLSAVARHWLPESFLFTLIMYILSEKNLTIEKRYLFCVIIAGIGTGVGSIVATALALIIFWLLFTETPEFLEFIKTRNFYLISSIFVLLFVAANLIYPGAGNGFIADSTLHNAKNLFGLLTSSFHFLGTLSTSEPILLFLAALGLITLFLERNRLTWVILSFIAVYSAAFYIIFRFEPRFLLPVIPLITILAGHGTQVLLGRLNAPLKVTTFALIFTLTLLPATRLSYLLLKNDSRIQAKNWVESKLPDGASILVSSRLTRLVSNKSAIEEQKVIDPNSLRKVDTAESYFNGNPFGGKSFHALNINSIYNSSFDKGIEKYILKKNYEYALIGRTNFAITKDRFISLEKIASDNDLIASFGSGDETYSISGSYFFGSPVGLFKINSLGPLVQIYKITERDNL